MVVYPANACWSLAKNVRFQMDKLLFWLGIGAAQKGAQSRTIESRNWVVSLVVGTLIAALIGVVVFLVLVGQKL
jgi:hypothetical protein